MLHKKFWQKNIKLLSATLSINPSKKKKNTLPHTQIKECTPFTHKLYNKTPSLASLSIRGFSDTIYLMFQFRLHNSSIIYSF